MTPIQFVTSHPIRVMCAIGLMAAATGLFAGTAQPGAAETETHVAGSTGADTESVSGKPPSQGSGVSERLRHKNRAVTGDAPASVSADQQAPGRSASAQHQETDMDFVRESATTKAQPQHTPEWSDPDGSDPGRPESSDKGGTTDINIGVGENQAAESDREVD